MIRKLCVIGVGLIGGSLARALRAAKVCDDIVGCGRNTENLQTGVDLGVIDRFDVDPARAVVDADMVVVAVPLGAMESVFRAIKPALAADAVVSDVGSAKTCVITAAKAAFGRLPPFLVPAHPIAGTERSGVTAAEVDLFQGRRVILTPDAAADAKAVARVRAMWEVAGALVSDMDAAHHDEVLAATSHLPHVLAFTLVDCLARMHDRREIFQYAAGGFRDFTRIAASDPVMWRDICLANTDALLEMIGRYAGDLDALAQAVRTRDGDALLTLFARAKEARDKFSAGD